MQTRHEIVGDIPLIIEFCKRLNLQEIVDNTFKNHGNHKGLSNGQLVLGWLAHILTENNHCKSPLKEWQYTRKLILQALLGNEISDNDFEDCRLGRLLEKFADDQTWYNFEESFYKNTFSILQLDTSPPENFKENPEVKNGIEGTIKLDSTTAYGYHEVTEDGIMQRGWSKDHRSDLPQLKIMVSVEGKTGSQIASDVVPGNQNDDPLYLPVLKRTRKTIDTTNCLICGDCKMSALYIRGDIVNNNEFYLSPLQLSNPAARKMFDDAVEKVVNGEKNAELIIDINENNKQKIIGAGYEFTRNQIYVDEEDTSKQQVEWTERILVIRSKDHAEQEIKRYLDKVEKVKKELSRLKSKLFKKKEDAKNELLDKLNKLKKDNKLIELFDFKIKYSMTEIEKKRGEKRNGKTREGTYKLKQYKAYIDDVVGIQLSIDANIQKMGWRLFVTNAEKSCLTFSSAYRFFRKTMYVIEIGFHVLKDYLNISPLFVREEKQILGLTRLLMLALKILTLMTAEVRSNMKKENVIMQGLYPGQPSRKHPAPTAQCLLKYFSRQNIALLGYKSDDRWQWGITSLTATCRLILKMLKIPENILETISEKLNVLDLK